MFKKIVIELTESICPCKDVDYSWSITLPDLKPGLKIECKKCATYITVPPQEFVASIKIDDDDDKIKDKVKSDEDDKIKDKVKSDEVFIGDKTIRFLGR